MLYCLYNEKKTLWREYFSDISRHDINSILYYASNCNSTNLPRAFFKIGFLD